MDWIRDLEEHPLEIEGAWIRICCKLWWSDTRGEMKKTLLQWGRILRESEEKTLDILRYLQREKIARIPENLTQPNSHITVISRRIVREEKERESNRLRQKRHYHLGEPNGKPNGNLTLPSSSSSSSSKEINIRFQGIEKEL
jgi:hypothetical protein